MRMINAGNLANVRFAVDGHALTVVEADATAVQPTVVQSVSPLRYLKCQMPAHNRCAAGDSFRCTKILCYHGNKSATRSMCVQTLHSFRL